MAMKAGADYKYHWLLQQAEMELGSGFSIRYQSKGAIAFDRFAVEHLRVSGFSEDKVFKAAENLLLVLSLMLVKLVT